MEPTHNTTEEWEKEFQETYGLGLYTTEYGYVHKIPNYEAIKQFISKIYSRDIDIEEINKENEQKSQLLTKELNRFHKLFGRFYIYL